MEESQLLRRRRSLRLNDYDYAAPGAYFVTLVTKDRSCLFGEIVDDQMCPNSAGAEVKRWWLELPRKFSTVATDEFVVMPNHCHGIIMIGNGSVGADLCVGPEGAHAGAPLLIHIRRHPAHTEAQRHVNRLLRPYRESFNGLKL